MTESIGSITTYKLSPRYPGQRELEFVAGTGWDKPSVDEYFDDLVNRRVIDVGTYIVVDSRPGPHRHRAYEYKVSSITTTRLIIV